MGVDLQEIKIRRDEKSVSCSLPTLGSKLKGEATLNLPFEGKNPCSRDQGATTTRSSRSTGT
jgi:hypothetical protein